MSVSLRENVNLTGSDPNSPHFHEPNAGSPESIAKRRATQSGPSDYTHQTEMLSVDELSKQLDDMKEILIKTSVRCHMLEVDLATQFSPYMVDTLRGVKQECEKCTLLMKLHDKVVPDATNLSKAKASATDEG